MIVRGKPAINEVVLESENDFTEQFKPVKMDAELGP